MPNPADKFTRYKQPPSVGKRFNLESPILAAYQSSQNTTMGVVTQMIEMPADQLDRCVVSFRGKSLQATCCHPDIRVGLNVAMIEQPIGIWWATCLQKSWYSRPLSELIDKGRKYQAALEYLLSFGPKWRPTLIIIDKRGEQIEAWPPDGLPFPWEGPNGIPQVPVNPETGNPFTFDEMDRNGDGVLTQNEWPFDPYLFFVADTNGDGVVTEAELAAMLALFPEPRKIYLWPYEITLHYEAVYGTDPAAAIAEAAAEAQAKVDAANKLFEIFYWQDMVGSAGIGWVPVRHSVVITTETDPFGQYTAIFGGFTFTPAGV